MIVRNVIIMLMMIVLVVVKIITLTNSNGSSGGIDHNSDNGSNINNGSWKYNNGSSYSGSDNDYDNNSDSINDSGCSIDSKDSFNISNCIVTFLSLLLLWHKNVFQNLESAQFNMMIELSFIQKKCKNKPNPIKYFISGLDNKFI